MESLDHSAFAQGLLPNELLVASSLYEFFFRQFYVGWNSLGATHVLACATLVLSNNAQGLLHVNCLHCTRLISVGDSVELCTFKGRPG